MKELNDLFAVPKVVKCGGEDVEILPIRLGDIPKVVPLVTKLGPLLDGGIDGMIAAISGEKGEAVLDLLALFARRPRTWVDELRADEALDLLVETLEVNASFFVTTLMPKLVGVQSKMTLTASSSNEK